MEHGPPRASAADVARVRDRYAQAVALIGDPVTTAHLELDDLSLPDRTLVVLIAAIEQVQCGGFEQLFYALPALAPETVAAAEAVKARRFVPVLTEANNIAFAEGPRKRGGSEFRRMMRAAEDNAEALAKLDDQIDALMNDPATRIEGPLARFLDAATQAELVDHPSTGGVRNPPASP